MKPYLSQSCSNLVYALLWTLSNWILVVVLGVTQTGFLLVGIGAAAEVDGVGLRLSVGAASLSGKKFRPGFPPTLVRLLDTKRLRICDKLINFITTQDPLYPRTASEILTETPCIIHTSLLLYQLVNRLCQVMDLTCWALDFLGPPGGSGELRYLGLP